MEWNETISVGGPRDCGGQEHQGNGRNCVWQEEQRGAGRSLIPAARLGLPAELIKIFA